MQVSNPYLTLEENAITLKDDGDGLYNLVCLSKNLQADAQNTDIENIGDIYEGVSAAIVECPIQIEYDNDGKLWFYVAAGNSPKDGSIAEYLKGRGIDVFVADENRKHLVLRIGENTIVSPLEVSDDIEKTTCLFISVRG